MLKRLFYTNLEAKNDATIIWERRSHLLVGICVVKNVFADVELV